MQKRFIDIYKDKIRSKSINLVEIYQDSFTIKPFRQNYDAKINIKPRLDTYTVCCLGDNLVLLGQVYDFGIFRRHLRPIYLILKPAKTETLKYVSAPKIHECKFNDNGLLIRFEKSIKGINMLIIKDFINPIATNIA